LQKTNEGTLASSPVVVRGRAMSYNGTTGP
jgi:hypothetical protein